MQCIIKCYLAIQCVYIIVLRKKEQKMASFKIPSTPPTTTKSIRFPNDVIEHVEAAIAGQDCTFSAFVVAAVRNALEQLSEEAKK